MSRIILLIVLAFLMGCTPSKPTRTWSGWYKLSGEVANLDRAEVKLSYNLRTDSSNRRIVKTTKLVDGKFSITSKIEEPVKASLNVGGESRTIYLDPTDQHITFERGDMYNYILTGGWTDEDFHKIEKQYSDLFDSIQVLEHQRMIQYNKSIRNGSINKNNLYASFKTVFNQVKLERALQPLEYEMSRSGFFYVKEEPNSFIVLLDLDKPQTFKIRNPQRLEIIDIYENMDVGLKNTPTGKSVGRKIDSIKGLKDAYDN